MSHVPVNACRGEVMILQSKHPPRIIMSSKKTAKKAAGKAPAKKTARKAPAKKAAKTTSARKVAKKTVRKVAGKAAKKTAKKAPARKAAKKAAAGKTAGKARKLATARPAAAADPIADAVLGVIYDSTDIRPITLDRTLGSLGFNTPVKLEGLARRLNNAFPGLGLRGADLKPGNTVREVIAIVKSKLG